MVQFRKKSKNSARIRTPGGTVKRPTYSYYGTESATGGQGRREGPQAIKTGSWKRRARMVPTVIALGAIFIAIVYSTTLTMTPKVHFAGDQSPYRTTADYQAISGRYMSESILNRSKLTINTSKFEAYVLNAFPELDAARVALPIMGRRPLVTLHVRQPKLVLTTKTSALVLDASGRAVSDTKQVSSSTIASLLTMQDESGLEIHIGEQAVTTETVAFIDNVRQQLDNKKLTIDHLVLPAIANEVDIYIKDLPYRIKSDVSGDARLQIGAFLAAKDSGVAPAEYMDVRVEEKVFYK